MSKADTKWWLANLALFALFIAVYLLNANKDVFEALEESPQAPDMSATNNVDFVEISLPSPPIASILIASTSNDVASDAVEISKDLLASTEAINSSTQSNKQASVNEAQHQLDMEDLSELEGRSFVISLPNDKNAREKVGDFLYKCVGIGFATWSKAGNKVGNVNTNKSLQNLNVLKSPKSAHSRLLRSVSPPFLSFEHQLMAVYGQASNGVRLYPLWFDKKLLAFINQNLSGRKLEGFVARLSVNNGLLQLSDIYLNDVVLAQVWTLASSYELVC